MEPMGDAIFYVIGLVFIAIYLFQGAVTGNLRNGRRRSRAWKLPAWGQLVCLLGGVAFSAAAVMLFLHLAKTLPH